jgi:hypothetical protein
VIFQIGMHGLMLMATNKNIQPEYLRQNLGRKNQASQERPRVSAMAFKAFHWSPEPASLMAGRANSKQGEAVRSCSAVIGSLSFTHGRDEGFFGHLFSALGFGERREGC